MLDLGALGGRLRGTNWARATYRAAVVSLLLLGAFFRTRRYWFDPVGLWADEASWCRRLLYHSLTELEFRPIGYMALTRLAVAAYSNEASIRILSYSAGLASLVIVWDLGRRLFRSRLACVLCLAVVAFHPALIDMSREFKPYSLEFCVHLGLIWLFVRWRTRKTNRRLYTLLICASVAFLFAYNIVFALPPLFLLLGYGLLRQRAYRQLGLTVLAALAALGIMGLIYVTVIRGMGSTESGTNYWGKKYDVFYLASRDSPGNPLWNHALWMANKYSKLAVFPNTQREEWSFPDWFKPALRSGLVAADSYWWLGLQGLGLVVAALKRRWRLTLLFGPVLVTMIFNLIGMWPFGVFRTSTFLLAYFILIPMLGLDALLAWRRRLGLLVGACATLLILGTNLSIGFSAHERKRAFTMHSEARSVLERLKALRDEQPAAEREQKTLLLLDPYTCPTLAYYKDMNDTTRPAFEAYLDANFETLCVRFGALDSLVHRLRGQTFYAIVSDERLEAQMHHWLKHRFNLRTEEHVRGAEVLYQADAR